MHSKDADGMANSVDPYQLHLIRGYTVFLDLSALIVLGLFRYSRLVRIIIKNTPSQALDQ